MKLDKIIFKYVHKKIFLEKLTKKKFDFRIFFFFFISEVKKLNIKHKKKKFRKAKVVDLVPLLK